MSEAEVIEGFPDWEPIEEFPAYEVSSKGGKIRRIRNGKRISVSDNGQGVMKVFLQKDGKFYTRAVGPIVARAFRGEPPKGCTVAIFLDGDGTNLDAENIAWKPRSYAHERASQKRRVTASGGVPMRNQRILMVSTGKIYENSLECAQDINGIEKWIVLAAGDPEERYYLGSHFQWVS